VSLAVHKKCVKQMISRRHADQDAFLPELCNAILPVLLEFKVSLVKGGLVTIASPRA
jgi:hypothetical protein